MKRDYIYNEDDAVPIRTKRKKTQNSTAKSYSDKTAPTRSDYLPRTVDIRQKNVTANSEAKIQKSVAVAHGKVRSIEKAGTGSHSTRDLHRTNTSAEHTRANYTTAEKRWSSAAKNQYTYSVKTQSVLNKISFFKIPYLIFVAVLLIISVSVIIYVHGALVDYESSQPENILQSQIDLLNEAKSVEEIEKILSVKSIRNELTASDEDIMKFKSDFLSGDIQFKDNHDSVDASKKILDVISDGYKVATFTLEHVGQETKLLIFTLDRWKIAGFESSGYEVNFASPISVTVKNGGDVVEGKRDETSFKSVYSIKTLTKPDIEICDVLGNSVKYDSANLPKFTDYKITVPSNFTIKGTETVPLSAATLTPIDSLKYVKEFCSSVPDTATYIISIMGGEPNFKIYDNNDDEINFELSGRKVEIDTQSGKDKNPLDADIDPLEVAKLWSFFMTQDLGGKTNGYYKISPYLIDGSYLQGVAWKWATGIDITFTSTHTLENPPFCTEKVSNFVKYSDDCFSCDILLEKNMHLSTGMAVKDTINSTFYFVKYDDTDNGIDDAHWVFVDYKEIQ